MIGDELVIATEDLLVRVARPGNAIDLWATVAGVSVFVQFTPAQAVDIAAALLRTADEILKEAAP